MFPVRYFSSNTYSELSFGDSSGDLAVSFIEGDLIFSCFLLEEGGQIVFSVVVVLYVCGDEAHFSWAHCFLMCSLVTIRRAS